MDSSLNLPKSRPVQSQHCRVTFLSIGKIYCVWASQAAEQVPEKQDRLQLVLAAGRNGTARRPDEQQMKGHIDAHLPNKCQFVNGANHADARNKWQALQPVVPPPIAPPIAPIAVTVTGTLTPVANFANRSLIRFGVGEVVNLGFTTNPGGQTAASFGGLTWGRYDRGQSHYSGE